MIGALILIPFFAGLAAFALRGTQVRRGLLVLVAVVHSALVLSCWLHRPSAALGGGLQLDSLGLIFLSIASGVFLVASIYALGYLRMQPLHPEPDPEEGGLFTNAPEGVFIGCLLMFLSAMTLVTTSEHLGLLWIGVEATTLASAPLIYFHRHHRSLEAVWKYLLICSLGIALALLGNFFLGVAGTRLPEGKDSMMVSVLVENAGLLHAPWLRAAFILFLVGYGTKMGLAPLHTWLPDAYSEAPSVVSALLSGALSNCAFLGVLRVLQICVAAGLGDFARELMVIMGLLSMGVAAVFILKQADYKRLLAYSSVENMGIMNLGVGLGGVGAFGSMLHAVNHSLVKTMLFLVAGNILMVYKTKSVSAVRGMFRVMPASGLLWIAGFLAITGTPPFGPFLSEFTILKSAFAHGRFVVGALYMFLLAVIFVGMSTVFLRMAQGTNEGTSIADQGRVHPLMIWTPAVLCVAVLMLGVYIPPALTGVLMDAARTVGGLI
jgi:hydrogenase-4 component F